MIMIVRSKDIMDQETPLRAIFSMTINNHNIDVIKKSETCFDIRREYKSSVSLSEFQLKSSATFVTLYHYR